MKRRNFTMSRSGIVNVRMVITEEKILSNIAKVQRLIDPNSKKQIVQLEDDAFFKDLVESIKTYLIEYPKKKNFPKSVYKAAYGLVEFATNEFEENTKQIEELIRQREKNIALSGELKDVLNMVVNKEDGWKESKFKGNIYHFSQVNFSYNSNKMEGSRLTSEQTEAIFETSSFISKNDDLIKLDDLIESKNHFKLFDYMLDYVDKPLSKEMIIEMNKILKRGTSDEDNPRYNVGGFKVVPNTIGVVNMIETSSPETTEQDVDSLLDNYSKLTQVTLEDIIDFHVKFERIHPFGDGNGRVGRIIMFKECLKNNIMPFIILDQDKPYYIRGLKEYNRDKKYLIDTILHSEDIYENSCEQLLDFDIKED